MPRGFNDYDTARLQGRLWTPAVLRPAGWWDATDLSTITISTGVSEWRDKSGNNLNVSQSTASLQPSYVQSAINGLPGVTFERDPLAAVFTQFASGKYLTASSYSSSNFGIVYSIIQTANSAFTYYPFGFGSSSGIYGAGTYTGPDRPQGAQSTGIWDGTSSAESTKLVSLNTPYIGAASAASSARRMRMNGGFEGSDSTTQTISAFRIGAQENNGWPMTGSIGEVVITSAFVGIYDVSRLEGYLSHKWAIPLAADHPFANRPPLIGD